MQTRGSGWALIAFVVVACGGTAIVDPPSGSGGTGGTGGTGASGGTTSSSDGGSTTVSSGCDCTDDSDCEQFTDQCSSASCSNCDCLYESFPDGTPCDFGICLDGTCEENPLTTETCEVTCEQLSACDGQDPNMCIEGCFDALSDCSSEELAQILDCNEVWLPACDVDGWLSCVPLGCVGN